jgi:hypothetical protein
MKTRLLLLCAALPAFAADGPQLQPAVSAWVTATAQRLVRVAQPTEAMVFAEVEARFKTQDPTTWDKQRLAHLVFAEALQLADKQLNDYIAQLKPASDPPKTAGDGVKAGISQAPGRVGPTPDGGIARGLGGVNLSVVQTNRPPSQPGALSVTRQQAAQLQAMTAQRNRLTQLANQTMPPHNVPASRLAELK